MTRSSAALFVTFTAIAVYLIAQLVRTLAALV